MTKIFLVAQGFGLIAVACFVLSFQIKSNRKLFIFQSLGCFSFMIQFFLLGAYSGCLSQLVGIVRNMLLTKYNKWPWVRNKWLALVFIGITAIITVCTWAGPISLLPFAAITGGTIGAFTNNASKIRMANLFGVSPAWLIYDLIVGAYTGVLNETILIVSIVVSIVRYGWKEMADPDSDFQKK